MSESWQQNVKQVFRIAVIGLKPSVQVKIKGYLRLILRMDFDIEWVKPKNPQVNLYIINPKFATSDSLASLLAESNNLDVPILFADKVADKSDMIEGNTLYLPLSEVTALEAWLHKHVALVGQKNNFISSSLAKPQTKAIPQTEVLKQAKTEPPILSQDDIPVLSDSVFVDDTDDVTTHAAQAASPRAETPLPAKKPVSYSDVFAPEATDGGAGVFEIDLFADVALNDNTLAFIDLIYSQKADVFYEVLDEGDVVAVINLKHGFAWPSTDGFYVAYSLNWRVRKIYRADINAVQPVNLNTWIWQKAIEEGSPVSEVLPLSSRVVLAGRPAISSSEPDYDNYMNIINVLESKVASSDEVANHLKLDHEFVHRCMAAFYVAGFMDMSQYAAPSALARIRMNEGG